MSLCFFFFFFLKTKAGPVLIALNPFKDAQIYGDDFVTAYKQKKSNNPHVFGVVDTAYDAIMRG